MDDPGPGEPHQRALPPEVQAVLAAFASGLAEVVPVLGLYGAGSLATGDYRPATSDLDMVAVLSRPATRGLGRDLRRLHRQLMAAHPAAARLHCAYVAVGRLADLQACHPTWAHGRVLQRPMAAIARAELARGGVVVSGPAPGELIDPVEPGQLVDAAVAELTRFWAPAARRPWLWLSDHWVDLGLLTVARGSATLAGGGLVTKTQALAMLPDLGVPPGLVAEVAGRRAGQQIRVGLRWRVRRARLASQLVGAAVARVLSEGPGRPS